MNIILLSGGSGKRLWPLSNDIRSKQFIKIFKRSDGTYESMLQRVYRQIRQVDPDANVVIATSKSQVSAIHSQLGEDVGLSIEPCRRDTFAAIALATAYLKDVCGLTSEDTVVVCPVDPYVEEPYFECVRKMLAKARDSKNKLVLMGIKPTYPSEKYGYIRASIAKTGDVTYAFTEKPDKVTAQNYIDSGALWNGGVFAYKLSYVLEKSLELLGDSNYEELLKKYDSLRKISFDYAVVEKEESIDVVEYGGTWKDLGTWNTLTEAMEENVVGIGQLNNRCINTHIINELDIPILGMGLDNIIVSASPQGILVSDKEQSSYIKPYVDEMNQPVLFAEKSWGTYRVVDIDETSITVKVTLNPGHRMNYHYHERRDEVWTVIEGEGIVILDGDEQHASVGDIFRIPAGVKHTIVAGESGVKVIEVQNGKDISVKDKVKCTL